MKKRIEVVINTGGGWGESATKTLQQFTQLPSPEDVLVLTTATNAHYTARVEEIRWEENAGGVLCPTVYAIDEHTGSDFDMGYP